MRGLSGGLSEKSGGWPDVSGPFWALASTFVAVVDSFVRGYSPDSTHQNLFIMRNDSTLRSWRKLASIVTFFFLLTFFPQLRAQQTINFPLIAWVATVDATNVPNTLCSPSSAAAPWVIGLSNANWFHDAGWPQLYFNGDIGSYHRATAGETSTFYIDVPAFGYLAAYNSVLSYGIGDWETGYFQSATASPIPNAPPGMMRFEIPATFPRGTQQGYFVCAVKDKTSDANAVDYTTFGFIPFVVDGPINPGAEVPAIDTIVEPQIPYLVLHAPPGDGSSSAFQESKTTCRNFQTSYAEDGSNSANLAVKVGVAGSAGLFVTTDFEFSVTVSAGLQVGDMSVVTTNEQMCVTVNQQFSTGALTDPEGGGDVFIGYGTDLALGLYPFLAIDEANCSTYIDTGLIYAPIGEPRNFIYTRAAIESDIADLEAVVADSLNLTPRAVNNALNQIDVWNQVLAMNEANINNPDNELLATTSFSGGTTYNSEEVIKTVETNSIEYKHYLNFNAGVTTVVEVGGSGFTGGYEYKGSKTFGETQNINEEQAKLIKYTLGDDDEDDMFNLTVVRDPMYGTPVFRLEASSETSCPYQGGYPLDQPALQHDGQTGNSITIENVPLDAAASFKVDLCNDSDLERDYYIKLNAQSNLNGAVVSAAGVPLNGNDLGQFFTIPAGSCIDDLVIEVERLSAGSPLEYPDLELYLYAACEEGIQSSVFASVFYEGATSVKELGSALSNLAVFPNPTQDFINVNFHLEEATQVRIAVSDLTGRMQQVLVDTYLPGGNQQQQLNLQDLPAGLYLLNIQTPSGQTSRKVQVIR
jgi:hypothetical protein